MISKLRHSPTVIHVSIILLLYGLMVLLVPPEHEFPVNDDWIYATSVRKVLNGIFVIPDWSQASQLTHALWGAGFARLFGFSFTTLTWSMIALAVLGSLVFYALLRRLDIAPLTALFGTLLLACNPLLIHLSYSFMTDVSFLTFTLLSCYCYLRGVQGNGEGWLWLGGAMAAVALLDRQTGLVVALVAWVYLMLAGQLNWRRAFATLALPALGLAGFLIWQASQPLNEASLYTATATRAAFADPLAAIAGRALRFSLALPTLGLFIPTLLRWGGRLFVTVAALLGSVVVWLYWYRGTVSFDVTIGNNFDSGGFQPPIFFHIPILTVGSSGLWLGLSVVAALLTAALLNTILGAAFDWGQRIRLLPGDWWMRIRAGMQPAHFIYLAGLLLLLSGTVITADVFDRYFLPVMPAIILLLLKQPSLQRSAYLRLHYIVLIPLFVFSLVAQRDYFAYAGTRWTAGQWLVSQGVKYEQMDGGFEWNGWWLYDKAVSETPPPAERQYTNHSPQLNIPFAPDALIDPIWRLEVSAGDSYQTIKRFSYTSWLDGGSQRYVLVLARPNAPPLPVKNAGLK